MFNLVGWCDITYYHKQATRFRGISFHWGCIPSLYFLQILITFCSDLYTHYFKVNCKTNHLAIIDNTIHESKCNTSYISIAYNYYFHAIKDITIGTVKTKIEEISDYDCLCLLSFVEINSLYNLLTGCKIVIWSNFRAWMNNLKKWYLCPL